MDIDTTTRAFTLPTVTLRRLERAAAQRNSPVDNTLAAMIADAIELWAERWPQTYTHSNPRIPHG